MKPEQDFSPGATLPNGAIVLDYSPVPRALGVVLTVVPGSPDPYATWRVDYDGTAFWGDYFDTLAEATESYNERREAFAGRAS
jgi:hypothetical protein